MSIPQANYFWSAGVMVITRDFESRDLGSIPRRTFRIHIHFNATKYQ